MLDTLTGLVDSIVKVYGPVSPGLNDDTTNVYVPTIHLVRMLVPYSEIEECIRLRSILGISRYAIPCEYAPESLRMRSSLKLRYCLSA
jgi:hypothetical protein